MTSKYGECRCCLAKGDHSDIMKEYYCNNKREVYINIFIDCFNIFLSTHTSLSTLICSSCIDRLREASNFRDMVVATERQLLSSLCMFKDEETTFVNVPGTLQNIVKEETKSEFNTFEDDDDSQDCGEVLMNIEDDSQQELHLQDSVPDLTAGFPDLIVGSEASGLKDLIDGEAALLARFPSLPALPTKATLPTRAALKNICPEFAIHLERLKGRTITTKDIQDRLNKNHQKEKAFQDRLNRVHKKKKDIQDRLTKVHNKKIKKSQKSDKKSDKIALAINACALLENSNATVFKTKMRSGYPCFYCRQIFFNLESLQQHQLIHPKTQLFKLLTKYTADELVVYADVTDLKCTVCDENIPNFNALKTHLRNAHQVKMYPDFTDRVIPYKLTDKDFECQKCGVVYETFGAVEKHMNTHYRNYICETCGTGFVTRHRLKIHAHAVHNESSINCEACNKTFSTKLKYKIHHDVVHKLLRYYKCPKCTEKFIDYFSRQKHLVAVHNMEPILYKCKVCDRSFNRRYSLSLHIKRRHLEQRDFKCATCSYTCYNKTELSEHMSKHSGVKEYECDVCRKAFARKRTLDCHMRIHNNERRFICNVCGQAFVHKCSLKGHLKSQHGQCFEEIMR